MSESSGHKGSFWKQVSFSRGGRPIFPEGFEEGVLPGYEAEVSQATLARVKFAAGRTINLGDFNSVRIDIGVELPCHLRDIENCREVAENFVGSKFAQLTNELISSKGALNTGQGRQQYLTENFGQDDDKSSPHY